MIKILNIETSSAICSVCIGGDDKVLIKRESTDDYSHASQLTLLIKECLDGIGLKMSDLDAVAVSAGPGSYTGLRIGSSTAKGICYALNKPLIAVDTLRSIALASAQQEKAGDLYCAMIDARRMEVYAAIYNNYNMPVTKTQSFIVKEDVFSTHLAISKVVFCGNGAKKCESVIQSPHAIFYPLDCSAEWLVPLSFAAFQQSNFKDIAYFSPEYFKSPNITKPKQLL